jgi:hypothetical protein
MIKSKVADYFRLLLLCSLGLGFAPAPLPAQSTYVQRPRAVIINFDPLLKTYYNGRLHQKYGWNSASTLAVGYVGDLKTASHGLVDTRVTRTIDPDVWPIKADGYRYDEESFRQCWEINRNNCHSPDGIDYKAIIRDYDLARKVDSGELDEILMFGAPYFGSWESTMAGRGGYWCNSGPQPRIACSRIFIVMGFNYERGIGEMLEDYGHRTESIMRYVYGSWEAQKTHAWNRFTLYDKEMPGEAACGNVHFAPNSQSDYDWGNQTYVWSTCDDWLNNYPNLTGQKQWVNCSSWGNGDMRQHHDWWFARIPHADGSTTEYSMTRLNNWWAYMQDFNRYAASNGDHVPGGTPPPAGAYPIPGRAITANANDDWSPRINASGQIVWHGSDGSHFQIYSADATGHTVRPITANSFSNEDPRINAAGRVVWQAFDGQDYELFGANADGTGLVQITNNTVPDMHPAINDSGRIVWDSFDGQDFEIWSANADGTDKVQITNNTNGGSGYPRDDVWPKINNAGRVAWFGYDGSHRQIFSANADGTDLVNVSNNNAENEYPEINDAGQVVWHGWPSSSNNTNTEIYSAPAAGGTVARLTNNTFEDWYPQINSSGTVVWMARVNNKWQIAQCSASGGPVTYLTNSTTHNQHPRIADTGQVVWQGFDGSDWEIYTYNEGSVQRVTDDAYDDRAPVVNVYGQIAWHGAATTTNGVDTTEIFVTAIPRKTADLDLDGDVDFEDVQIFEGCMTATNVPPADPNCRIADLDDDGDVDQSDFGRLQSCLNGPRHTPPEGC